LVTAEERKVRNIIGGSLSQIIVFMWRDNGVVPLGLKQARLTAIGIIIVAVIIFLAMSMRWKKYQRQS
jgi:hypothetical protein